VSVLTACEQLCILPGNSSRGICPFHLFSPLGGFFLFSLRICPMCSVKQPGARQVCVCVYVCMYHPPPTQEGYQAIPTQSKSLLGAPKPYTLNPTPAHTGGVSGDPHAVKVPGRRRGPPRQLRINHELNHELSKLGLGGIPIELQQSSVTCSRCSSGDVGQW